jgi:tetratricopeptide (TPR) repeat protein
MDDISKFERSEDISSMNSSNKKDLQVFIKVDDIERKALAMIQSFQQTKHVAELDQAQDMLRLVLEHRPPGHPTRDNALGNLGNVLHMRYEFTKNLDFLSEAIELYRESLQLRDPGTPKHFASLHSLATILGKRFIRTRHDDSLEEAVCLSRQVLQLCPIGSTDRGIHLYNLANLLRSNFEHLGDSRILQEAIDLLQEALLLFPSDSRYRGPLLINLATTLLLYYEEVADLEMLDEAIYLSEELMIYLPHNHPEHRLALSRLASALRHKYERSGNSDLLMRSIRLHRESLQLTPSDHPERDISLNNLSTALVRYFERVGDPDARTEAIELFQQTLELRPRSHPNRDSALSNLGVLLSTYARDKEDYQILHEAILLLRESLESRQSGHPGRSISLENLAVAFGIKFQLSGDPAALEDCIVNHREALKLRPPGHKNHISSVNNLAGALANKTDNDTVFFEEAISLVRNALAITHDENPERCSLHYAMARLLLRDSLYFSWDESFQHLSLAIANPTTSARAHLSAMIEILPLLEQAITRFPDEKGYSQRTLDIYIQIINLLPRVAHFGLNLPSRLRELSTSEHLCRTAATRAFLLDRIDTAIEIIETGKAIFWAQTLRLRTSELDQLPTEEKAELSGLLQLLEQGGQNISEQPKNRAYVEQISNEQRRLNDRAEQMIDEIRLRPGFDRFLRTPSFNLLSQAAENGPVIMLIPADSGCMAVSILNSSGATKVTHLRSITPEILQNLCLRISDAGLRDGGNANTKVDDTKQPSERMAFHISQPRSTKNNFTSDLVLGEIWSKIVKPVIDMLGLKVCFGI